MVSSINTHEYLFSVDNFGDPAVVKNAEAIATLLTRLLLLEPGTIQSHPSMGVGLVSKYRYTVEDRLIDLRDDFKQQIEKYLPQYQGVEVQVFIKEKICYINATIDNTVYAFFYDTDKNSIKSTFKKLEDL